MSSAPKSSLGGRGDENADPFTNAVRITVSALRKRLGEPWIIATVAGVGYRIDTHQTPDVRRGTVDRAPGLSVRLKLTLSYAGFLMLAGALMLAAAWLAGQHRQSFEFLLRYVPDGAISTTGGLVPGNSSFLLRAFAPAAAIVLAFLLVFGLLGGWLLAGRMLAPLTRITDATRMAANGSLSHRIRLPGRRDEFRELADAFDAMLARLEAHVAEQQRFAANAFHELRTPLAITQTLLDVARNDLNRDTGELVDRLHAVNTRAIDLTEALLLLSHADQRSFTREHVDLSPVAEEATETLLPPQKNAASPIETFGDVTPTIGSHALLLQMTTNLVHNAIVHNLPEQGTVWVTTSAHPKVRGAHCRNTRREAHPTAGLDARRAVPSRNQTHTSTEHEVPASACAIVKSITQAHDGTLTLELLKDVSDVSLDGRLADVELVRDLRVGEAADHQAKDVSFALTELLEFRRRIRMWRCGRTS